MTEIGPGPRGRCRSLLVAPAAGRVGSGDSGTRRPARLIGLGLRDRSQGGRPSAIRPRSLVDAGSSRSIRTARVWARAKVQSPLIKSRAWVAVVVVLRWAVGKVPVGRIEGVRSASRVLRITRVSIVAGALRWPARATHHQLELAAAASMASRMSLGVEPLDRPFPEQAIVGNRPARPRRCRAGCAGMTGDRPPRSGSTGATA